jgi:hypothetical protein
MSGKISVLTFAATGQALAVLTRAADAEGAKDAKVAAPNGIRIVAASLVTLPAAAQAPLGLHVPAEHLGINVVDYSQDLVLHPSSDVRVSTLAATPTGLATAATADGITVTVTVKPNNAAPSAIDFWVFFEEANPADPANPSRRVTRGSIAAGAANGSALITLNAPPPSSTPGPAPVGMPLEPGKYNVVAFVPSYTYKLDQITV